MLLFVYCLLFVVCVRCAWPSQLSRLGGSVGIEHWPRNLVVVCFKSRPRQLQLFLCQALSAVVVLPCSPLSCIQCTCIHVCTCTLYTCMYMYTCMYVHVYMLMRRKEERSKQGQTNNKAKQHSTPKAVTFPKKNELPRVRLEPTRK